MAERVEYIDSKHAKQVFEDGHAPKERRQLKMHQSLLWSVIHRQAGTIGKAILEGVMNSVDAGATECHIEIDRDRFEIKDNGKGFVSDQEIEEFFETFGTPHEEGDATYGRFRMGRGQMMAFGANVWHTNNYKMVVDLKPQQKGNSNNEALGYDFYKIDEHTQGCHIDVDLYDKLSPSALDNVLREIKENMKYVEIPVFLNGKQISIDPATEEWDEITDDAYIKRKGGGTLDIYNLGVLVTKQSQYVSGASGIIVSKKALDVNFARNAVQASCPVWKRVLKVLKEDNLQALKKKVPLDDVKRDFFARELVSGEMSVAELDENRIITDVTNSHHPFSLFSRLTTFQNKVSIASRGDRVAEMAHTRRLAFVVTPEMAERFNATTPKEFVQAIKDICVANGLRVPNIKAVDAAEFSKVISSTHEPVADKELNKAERVALKALREAGRRMYESGSYYDYRNNVKIFSKDEGHPYHYRGHETYRPRHISVGVSDTAAAWTDGEKNIWIERRQLKKVKDGIPGMIQLANIILHEYLHNDASTNTHEHGVEFYNRHHDLNVYTTIVPDAANVMMKSVLKSLKTDDKVLSQKLSSYEDTAAKAADHGVGESLDEVVVYETDEEIDYRMDQEPQPMAALVAPVAVPVKKKKKVETDDDQQYSMKL